MWLCLRAVRQRPCFLPTPRSQGRTRTLALHTVQPSQARRPQSSGKEAERAFGPTAPASLCSQPACFITQTLLILLTGFRKRGAPVLPDVQQKAEGRGGVCRPCRTDSGSPQASLGQGSPAGTPGRRGGLCGGDVLGSPGSVWAAGRGCRSRATCFASALPLRVPLLTLVRESLHLFLW